MRVRMRMCEQVSRRLAVKIPVAVLFGHVELVDPSTRRSLDDLDDSATLFGFFGRNDAKEGFQVSVGRDGRVLDLARDLDNGRAELDSATGRRQMDGLRQATVGLGGQRALQVVQVDA